MSFLHRFIKIYSLSISASFLRQKKKKLKSFSFPFSPSPHLFLQEPFLNPKGANSPTLQSWGEKGTELGQRSPQVATMSPRCQEQRGEHGGSPQGGGELLGAPQSEGLGTSGLLAVREGEGCPLPCCAPGSSSAPRTRCQPQQRMTWGGVGKTAPSEAFLARWAQLVTSLTGD